MRIYLTFSIFLWACLTSMPSNAAEPIGRLFTTAGERSHLEYLRKTRKNISAKTEQPVETAIVTPEVTQISLPEAVNLQGYVKRNDGKSSTVWVNGQALQENSTNKEVAVGSLPENSNRIPIRIKGDGRYIGLKAGQVYDPATNRVREARNHAAQGDSGRIDDESRK